MFAPLDKATPITPTINPDKGYERSQKWLVKIKCLTIQDCQKLVKSTYQLFNSRSKLKLKNCYPNKIEAVA